MSKADDRHAGPNNGAIAGQARKILNWMNRADFVGDPDRAAARFAKNPDQYIDPSLSASVNYDRVKDQLGLRTQTDQRKVERDAVARAEDSAREAIRENLDAIDDGGAEQLLADVRDEYGREWLARELKRARTDATADLGGAPDPNDSAPSAPANVSGAADVPTPDPTPATEQAALADVTPDPTPAPTLTARPENTREYASRTLRAIARLPAPVRSLAVAIYVAATYDPRPPANRTTPT